MRIRILNIMLFLLQENHMNSVMMDVLGAGAAAAGQAEEEEQLMERVAEQTRLGVNLLLFAGSRWARTRVPLYVLQKWLQYCGSGATMFFIVC